jgi:prepilin-type N-terminal cleavage/methylation domain-containing protein
MRNVNIVRNQHGFTLVELVIAIVINAIVGIIILTAVMAGFRGLGQIYSVKKLNQEGEFGLSKFSREATLTYRFIYAAADELTFKSTQDTTITINYLLFEDNLWRDIGGGYRLVVNNVNSGASAFSYYNSVGGAPASLTDIRRIRLTLAMQHGNETIPLTADVFPAVTRFKEG